MTNPFRHDLILDPERQAEAWAAGAYDYLEHPGYSPRYTTLAGYIEALCPHANILELQCGTAPILPFLPPTCTYVGLDSVSLPLERAQQRLCQVKRDLFLEDVRQVPAAGLGDDFQCLLFLGATTELWQPRFLLPWLNLPKGRFWVGVECFHRYDRDIAEWFSSLNCLHRVELDLYGLPDPHLSPTKRMVRFYVNAVSTEAI